jgi:hypothetical protein
MLDPKDELFQTQLDRSDSFPIRLTYDEMKYLVNLLANHKAPYAGTIVEKIFPYLKAEATSPNNANGDLL